MTENDFSSLAINQINIFMLKIHGLIKDHGTLDITAGIFLFYHVRKTRFSKFNSPFITPDTYLHATHN